MVSVQFHDELASKAQVVVRCAGDAVAPINAKELESTKLDAHILVTWSPAIVAML